MHTSIYFFFLNYCIRHTQKNKIQRHKLNMKPRDLFPISPTHLVRILCGYPTSNHMTMGHWHWYRAVRHPHTNYTYIHTTMTDS